uniref:Uncharacterized protein n=1 Tax=Arundo donax TaxID=35708 RepID=A0A0A9F9S7_ARUDO
MRREKAREKEIGENEIDLYCLFFSGTRFLYL